MSMSLRDLTNEQLISYLNKNETLRRSYLLEVIAETLRRMNENEPLLPKEDKYDVPNERDDWANPLIP